MALKSLQVYDANNEEPRFVFTRFRLGKAEESNSKSCKRI